MGLDGELVHPRVCGEHERHGGAEAATAALLLEQVGDGAGTRGLVGEGLVDGGGEGGRAVVVEQREEPPQLRHARIAVRGPLGEEAIERRHGLP